MAKDATARGDLPSSASDQALDVPGQFSESIVPVSSRELFWRAKFLRDAPSLAHLPFLFWLVGDLRPYRTVTLNAGAGVGHFALCQAVEKTGLDAVCLGFGGWENDAVPEELADYNADQYGDFSTLAALGPAKARRRVQKGSIDLLLIEGGADLDLGAILNDWPFAMSDRGMMVLTAPDTLSEADAERLESWCADRATVRFSHHGGLLAVLLGDDAGYQSERLSKLDVNSAAFITIERIFSRLGAAHLNEWTAQDKSRWARALSDRLKGAEKGKDAAQAEASAAKGKIAELEDAYAQRQRKAAEAEAALHSAREELQTRREHSDADRAAADEALAELERLKHEMESRVEAAERDRDDAQRAAKDLKAQAAQSETAHQEADRLRADLAEAKRAAEDADARTDAQRKKAEAATQAQAGLQDLADTLLAERDALKDSLAEAEEALADTSKRAQTDRAALETSHESLKADFKSLKQERDGALAFAEAQTDRSAALEAELAALTDLLDRESAQRISLSEELADARRVEGEAEETHAREIDVLTEALSAAEERSILRAERIKALEDERGAAQVRIDGLQADLTQARLERDREESRHRMLETELKRSEEQRAAARTKLAKAEKDMKARIEALREHGRQLEAANAALKQSTSWKVTAPLRSATSAIRGKR